MVLSNLTSPVSGQSPTFVHQKIMAAYQFLISLYNPALELLKTTPSRQHLLHRPATTALQRKPSRIVTRKPGQNITQTALTEASSLFRLLALPLWNCLRLYRVRGGRRRRCVPSSRDEEKET